MKHVWENHLGGLYTDDEYVESYSETCEQCGDSDWYLGEFDNADQLIEYLMGYELSYIRSLFEEDTQ